MTTPAPSNEEIREKHYEHEDHGTCNCGAEWPCLIVRLADEAERLRARLVEISTPGWLGAFAARDHWKARAEAAEARATGAANALRDELAMEWEVKHARAEDREKVLREALTDVMAWANDAEGTLCGLVNASRKIDSGLVGNLSNILKALIRCAREALARTEAGEPK